MEPYWLLSSESEEEEAHREKKAQRRMITKSSAVGFVCINKLMNRVISTVVQKARARLRAKAKRTNETSQQRKIRLASQKTRAQKWYKANRDNVIQKQSEFDKTDIGKQRRKECHIKHRSKRLESMKTYRELDSSKKKHKDRVNSDPILKMHYKMRRRLHTALSGKEDKKKDRTFNLIGCTRKLFVEHLQTQCRVGENVLELPVDHIFPFAVQDTTTKTGQQRVMHFTNCQPLTKQENQNKYSKLPTKAMAAKVDRDKWPPGITEDMLPDIYPGWATPLRMHAAPTPGASSSTDTTSVVDESMSSSESDSDDSDDSDNSDSD
jgi:hypothetical protein